MNALLPVLRPTAWSVAGQYSSRRTLIGGAPRFSDARSHVTRGHRILYLPPSNSARPTVEHSYMAIRLDDLAALPCGWDGENADPPSAAAVNFSRTLLDRLDGRRLPHSIDADALGGIAFWFYVLEGAQERRRFAVEIRNTCRAILSIEESTGEVSARRVGWDVDEIARNIEELFA